MRAEFSKAILPILKESHRAIFLTGDLGFNALEDLQSLLKGRFINVGVAEQNMIGVASGLAIEGYHPWVYSIATFLTLRCLEQIRNDVCFHNLNVKLVGNGGGYTYGPLGSTHHAMEDMAVLKGLPNLELFFPAGNDQVASALSTMVQSTSPSYLRLGISAFVSTRKPISENPRTLTRCYREGSQIVVIGVGQASQLVLNALDHYSLGNASTFSIARFPIDLENDTTLSDKLSKAQDVVLVEEHYLSGSISESLRSLTGSSARFHFLTPQYHPEHTYGSSAFHHYQARFTSEALAKKILELEKGAP